MNCKICHTSHTRDELDDRGRCRSFHDAYMATRNGLHYGDYMAAKPRPYVLPVAVTPLRELPIKMIHLGDITKIHGCTAPIVDCMIGGSPCQDLIPLWRKRLKASKSTRLSLETGGKDEHENIHASAVE